MTLTKINKLDAINSILSSIGQAPIIKDRLLNPTDPQIVMIENIFHSAVWDVLLEEWHFNTEKHVEFQPQHLTSGYVAPAGGVPSTGTQIHLRRDILRIDVSDDDINRQYDIMIRGGEDTTVRHPFLYDKVNHTDLWTHSIHCDCVYKAVFDFDPAHGAGPALQDRRIPIPEVFKRYIILRASTRAATQLTNNTSLIQALAQQELLARAACMEYESNQTDASFFGFEHNSHYKSYRPYQAMLRR